MPKATAYITPLLQLIFNNTAFSTVAAAGALANLFVSLHTVGGGSGPGIAGDQTTNEVGYTNYARVQVVRSSGWTVSGDHVNPAATITFPAGGSGTSPVASYFGIGTLTSGAGILLYFGTVTPNITCGDGITPALSTATQVTES